MSEKTCGNCFHSTPRHYLFGEEYGVGCNKRGDICFVMDTCDEWKDGSGGHTLENLLAGFDEYRQLEQRYEKLEQVARNMYQKHWGNAYNEDPTLANELRKNMADIITEQYREQLEDCGVSVDD